MRIVYLFQHTMVAKVSQPTEDDAIQWQLVGYRGRQASVFSHTGADVPQSHGMKGSARTEALLSFKTFDYLSETLRSRGQNHSLCLLPCSRRC